MKGYKTARVIFEIIEIVSWGAVIIGAILALAGASGGASFFGRGAGFFGALPGVTISFIGLLIVIIIQMARTQVDIAYNTGELLKSETNHRRRDRHALPR